MQEVAAGLNDAQIVDVAAYVGSRPAWTRAELAAAMSAK
jgi:cytochrome c553